MVGLLLILFSLSDVEIIIVTFLSNTVVYKKLLPPTIIYT